MLPKKKQAIPGRNCTKASSAFDPVAYATSIAMSAAEKRLRAPHMRDASSSAARPSSARRRVTKGALAEALQGVTAASSHTVSGSMMSCSSPPQLTEATAGPRTLLEELASTTDSSVDANTPPKLTRAALRTRTLAGLSRNTSVHSPSPPTPSLPDIPAHSASLGARTASQAARKVKVRPSKSDNDDYDGTMSLHDASPLREHSVFGSTCIRYRTCTVESVHSTVRQLNFSLYQ
ncbi:hypothetical protein LSCM1_00763 [Leishmania martiniquensis]|uniref:Uncharacterized protein n=1 Tax=Leishmania martiniquensis TaxID=1580590 RepID=A0A836KI87_9TRYP|nr:hypothetical protein LSCM1_00763 [Leishmania martiniquensis]